MRESMPTPWDPNDPHGAPSRLASSALPLDLEVARRRSFIGDVAAGLFLGDFARDLRLPGAVTQVAISFVPLIGSICALRDLIADLRHHDHVGAALNALALTPILGGFSKTFEVIRSTAHVGHAVHSARHQAQRRHDGDEPQPSPRRSRQRPRH